MHFKSKVKPRLRSHIKYENCVQRFESSVMRIFTTKPPNLPCKSAGCALHFKSRLLSSIMGSYTTLTGFRKSFSIKKCGVS